MIESRTGRQVIALDVDVVRTPSEHPLAERLLTISDTVDHWMNTHLPDVIAIERVFANANANTAMGTARAAGVIAGRRPTRNRRVLPHPSEVKAAVTGNGRADKAQVTAMVTKILALQQKPTPADAADALALAICHCWRAPMIARMAKAEAMAAEQRRAYAARMKAARHGPMSRARHDRLGARRGPRDRPGSRGDRGRGRRLQDHGHPSTLATLRRGAEARLITAMIVREDSQTLYGFAEGDARDLFLTLLGVSGVGPKIALATLAVYDAAALRRRWPTATSRR